MKRIIIILPIFILFIFNIVPVFAHEQYVLTKDQLNAGFADKNLQVFDALKNPANIRIALLVGIGIMILMGLSFFLQYSRFGKLLERELYKLENIGHFFIRVSLALSLFASAYFHSFLGPEIPVTSVLLGNLLIPILYILGFLLLVGLFTRAASLLGLLVLILATFVYQDYMFTYFNYYGEYLALIIFGSYFLSVDNKFFGTSKLTNKFKDLEIFILRLTYGLSVLYPAITIKLLHPAVIVDIYNKYDLGKIWWLFPKDPLLTSLGTGLAQVLVGLLIIIGFQTRLASLMTFLLYFGSVIFFKEAVWPHIVLLALAFYFVVNNGGKLTVDNLIGRRFFLRM